MKKKNSNKNNRVNNKSLKIDLSNTIKSNTTNNIMKKNDKNNNTHQSKDTMKDKDNQDYIH